MNQFSTIEQIERWPAGEVIFLEGDQPRGIFILYSGSVDLISSARTGLKKRLRTAIPGEILGLSEAISSDPYDCSATARTAVKIGFVRLEALRSQLEETPALWFTIAKYLSANLDSCWASMRTQSQAR